MRVSLSVFESKPYISLRLWRIGEGNLHYPSKTGASIRIREIPDLLAGLRQVEELLASGDFGGEAPRQAEPPVRGYGGSEDEEVRYVEKKRRRESRPFDPHALGTPPSTDFDEF